MIRSTLCSLRYFATLDPLLQMALVSFVLGLMFAVIQFWTFNVVDYDLEGASVETFMARVLYADRGGLMVEEVDGGELRKLKVVRGISHWNLDTSDLKGQTLTFTRLRDYLLSCRLDGEERCSPLCATASECLESRRERESSLVMVLFWFVTTLICLGRYALRGKGRTPGSDR